MNIEDDILIVDDEIPNLRLLTELLEKEGYRVRPAETAQTALDSALVKQPGLILLDVRMPEMDGFELCRRLKQDRRTKHVPVIFVSALQDLEARIQGFEAGGVDFISKPFQELEVLARVRTHMSLHRSQQHLEQLVEALKQEIQERKKAEEATRERTKELDERVKELNCLYGISNLVEKPDISLEEIFQGVVDLIPPSWQYPEITCSRMLLEDKV